MFGAPFICAVVHKGLFNSSGCKTEILSQPATEMVADNHYFFSSVTHVRMAFHAPALVGALYLSLKQGKEETV